MKNGNLLLVGMSNIGKTHWQKELAQKGFIPYWVDARIEMKLGPYLREQGYRGIRDVTRWMGQPYEERYPVNCGLYLQYENESMREFIRLSEAGVPGILGDATGSVIYLEEVLLRQLRERATIVLLDSPESAIETLYRKFIAEPKPVVWGDSFNMLPGEAPQEALKWCYPELLRYRNERYHTLAHVVLDPQDFWAMGFKAEDFLAKIEEGGKE